MDQRAVATDVTAVLVQASGRWQVIESQYGLRVRDAQPVRDVWRLDTDKGALCLKPCAISLDNLHFLATVLTSLEMHGFGYSPRLHRTLANGASVHWRQAHCLLTNWVDGATPDFHRPADLTDGVRRLAEFHRVADRLPIDQPPRRRQRIDSVQLYPGHVQRRIDSYLRQRKWRRWCEDERLTAALLDLYRAAQVQITRPQAQAAIAREHRLGAFVHGDYNYPNLVRNGDGEIELIDFDNTAQNVRVADLAHVLQRNRMWRAADMLRLVEAYDHVRTLDLGERALLRGLLLTPYPLARDLRTGRNPFLHSSRQAARRWARYARELETLG